MPLAKRVKRELKSKGGMSQPLDLIRQDRLRFDATDQTQHRWGPRPPRALAKTHSQRRLSSSQLPAQRLSTDRHMRNLDLQAQLLQRRPHDLGQLIGVHQAGPQAVVQMIALPWTHSGHEDRGGERERRCKGVGEKRVMR